MRNFADDIKRNILSIPGWKTKRKIIVFESDDWGSIRSISNEVNNEILRQFDINLLPYHLFDSLESEEDLDALYDVLLKFKDSHGNPPIITANCLVANPNFGKIELHNFQEYHYELVTETFKNSPGKEKSFELWKEGISEKIFHPQYHGREHLNVSLWLNLLKSDSLIQKMFDYKFWGMEKRLEGNSLKIQSMAGCNYSNLQELDFVKNAILDGLEIFEQLFGFKSKSFIANNFIWDENVEGILSLGGVKYIQGQSFQLYPFYKRELIKEKGKRNFMGRKNSFNQTLLIRNCDFEPSLANKKSNCVTDCLDQIDRAFFWNNPAIISSHRLNFIGSLSIKNRTNNLEMLKTLLSKILFKYPEVEFMTTDQLGDLITNDNFSKIN